MPDEYDEARLAGKLDAEEAVTDACEDMLAMIVQLRDDLARYAKALEAFELPTPRARGGAKTCASCVHYSATVATKSGYRAAGKAEHGACDSAKWVKSYSDSFGVGDGDLKPDMVLVEPDEGWGFFVGPDFGCIHHAPR